MGLVRQAQLRQWLLHGAYHWKTREIGFFQTSRGGQGPWCSHISIR